MNRLVAPSQNPPLVQSEPFIIRTVLEKNPAGKRPIERPCMRWADLVQKDVEAFGRGSDWKE